MISSYNNLAKSVNVLTHDANVLRRMADSSMTIPLLSDRIKGFLQELDFFTINDFVP